jgi:hypothetical protein
MASRKSMPTLSDEQLGELLGLVEGADSVELKLTVPESDHHAAGGVLGLDPLDAQIRQVYFFDTPDLSLSRAGVVARARRVQGKGDDAVVKLRPVVPDQLPKKLRKTRGFGVEVDAMPGGFVCSGSMKSPARADVRETVTGARSLRKLFSKEQQAFFSEYAGDGIELDDLSILGPIFVLKLKFRPEELQRRLAPRCGCIRITRGSWSCPRSARRRSHSSPPRCAAFLSDRGVDLSGEQETKTRKALEFFSKRLTAGA